MVHFTAAVYRMGLMADEQLATYSVLQPAGFAHEHHAMLDGHRPRSQHQRLCIATHRKPD